jgi:predicted acetyltransferase
MKLIHRSTSGPLPTSSFDFVATDGTVLGFAQVRHRPSCNADLPPEAANHVYYEIAAPYRGAGYGKILMGLTLAEAKRIGLDRARLTVLEGDPASKHIIQGHGGVWVRDFIARTGETYHLFEIDLAGSA